MVGNKPDSATYVMAKTKLAKECGFRVRDILLPETSTQEEVVEAVQKLNADGKIHGILMKLWNFSDVYESKKHAGRNSEQFSGSSASRSLF